MTSIRGPPRIVFHRDFWQANAAMTCGRSPPSMWAQGSNGPEPGRSARWSWAIAVNGARLGYVCKAI